MPWRKPRTVISPQDHGYVTGYKDRHRVSGAEHVSCMSTTADCLAWLAGWREGQADRRRDMPEHMRYEPLWPSEATAIRKGIER